MWGAFTNKFIRDPISDWWEKHSSGGLDVQAGMDRLGQGIGGEGGLLQQMQALKAPLGDVYGRQMGQADRVAGLGQKMADQAQLYEGGYDSAASQQLKGQLTGMTADQSAMGSNMAAKMQAMQGGGSSGILAMQNRMANQQAMQGMMKNYLGGVQQNVGTYGQMMGGAGRMMGQAGQMYGQAGQTQGQISQILNNAMQGQSSLNVNQQNLASGVAQNRAGAFNNLLEGGFNLASSIAQQGN